jgi:hypothetical protein
MLSRSTRKTVGSGTEGKKVRRLEVKKKSEKKTETLRAIYINFFIIACTACGETFEDDWIQCGGCLEWLFEDCYGWEGGDGFLCDRC